MSLLQKIREFAGVKYIEVADEDEPIVVFEKASVELDQLKDELKKAQSEFDE